MVNLTSPLPPDRNTGDQVPPSADVNALKVALRELQQAGLTSNPEVAAMIVVAIDGLKGNAPAAFDTLVEVATELARGANAETALMTAIGARYLLPSGGMPSTDLSSAVRAQLTDARVPTDAGAAALVNTGGTATRSAVQAIATAAVSAVVGAAPAAFDTLVEIAGELSRGATAETALTNAIGLKYTLPAGGVPPTDIDRAALAADPTMIAGLRGLPGQAGPTGSRGPRSGPRAISSRGLGRSQTATSTAAVETTRTFHTFVEDATGIRVVLTGWWQGETDQPGPLTVRAALELGSTITPFTFGGAQSVVVAPGAYVVSDALGVNVLAGATGWVRAERTASGGIAVGGTAALRASLGEGIATATTAVYGAATGFTTVTGDTSTGWTPLTLVADSSAGRAVAIVGDSVSNGQRETTPEDGGYMPRALGSDVGIIRLNNGGGTAEVYVGNSSNPQGGRRRVALAPLATYAWVEFGANDLNGGASLATVQANLLRLWRTMAAAGLVVVQSTITPWSSSTDSWATVAGQTPFSAHAVRIALNDWIRTTPAPLSGYVEVADAVESSRNSGVWALTDGAAAATDGIHPTSATYAKIAAAIRPTVLSLFPVPVKLANVQGPQGGVGNTGQTGSAGAPGASAYAVAVANGFTGTMAEWLTSLKGAKGDAGSGSVVVWDEQLFGAGVGTWTKPVGAVDVEVDLVGGGGGGGSGRRGAAGTARSGGAGGGSAGRTIMSFRASDLPATVEVTVPAGGAGGAAPTTDDTNGAPGGLAATATSFGSIIRAPSAGTAAASGTAAAVAATSSTNAMYSGGIGGAVSTAGAGGGNGTTAAVAPGGGGAGGGLTSGNVASGGGNGASSHTYVATGGAKADPANSLPASGGTITGYGPASGAGGGYGGGDATYGKGGDALAGAGGGGGGASVNGQLGGAGGKGGDGVAMIRTLCIR